jgi:hypothetical protein
MYSNACNYTRGKFATGINDTRQQNSPAVPLVLLIPVANLQAQERLCITVPLTLLSFAQLAKRKV